MTIVCPHSPCKNRFEPVWGHLVCPYHSPCIAPGWVYDPSRCSHCTDFFNNRIIGANSVEDLRTAKKDLSRFLKKLRGFAFKYEHSLSFSAFVLEIKLPGKSLSYYQSLPPLDVSKTTIPDHTLSESDSSMSHSSNPPPSISGSSLASIPPSETPSRRSGVSSSASRNLELQAELDKYKSFVQAHGLSLLGSDKPVTPKQPVDSVSVPARPLGQDVSSNVGLSSLPLSIPITGSLRCTTVSVYVFPHLRRTPTPKRKKKKFHTRQFKSRAPRETQCCVPLSEISAHHTHTTPITQASLHPPIPPFWSLLPPANPPSNTAVSFCEPISLSFH